LTQAVKRAPKLEAARALQAFGFNEQFSTATGIKLL
jgi:hypothetical protein